MKNKTLVLIILLITGIMFSASMEDYVSVEGLPKTLDEANYSLKIRGETANSAYEVFTFVPFEWKNIKWE
ncbi:MAG: hypothetical protein ACP5D6_11535, partial [Kosmotogaceae bacterium]